MENKESDYYFNLLCLEQKNLRLLKEKKMEMKLKEKKMKKKKIEME